MTLRRWDRPLLAAGVVGPVVFSAVALIAGAVRPDYQPLRHPVSSLSIGPAGWQQTANFMITGVLILIFAVGVYRVRRRLAWGAATPVLIAVLGIGMIGAGLFVTDPIGGYPPGTSPVPAVTLSGTLHDGFSMLFFFGLPALCGVVAYRQGRSGRRGWMIGSVLIAAAFLASFVLAALGFQQLPGWADWAGFWQRLTIMIGYGWLAVLAGWLMVRTTSQH